MNRILFGDNLPILQKLPDESVDLIYVDPPFNTRKTQKRTTIKTVWDVHGDRRGFQGRTYRTIELGTKSYEDSLDSQEYIQRLLRPRLEQAHRVLKPHGSLYFHVDYREVHYCKVLLDKIFGRECFLNEIIWAYDYGGRARSKWPAKHDNILFYVKDPKNYIFNSGAIDREPYMAPGLVGPEKAETGKLPTDVWWPGYLAARLSEDSSWLLRGQNAVWWQTIVPTNSRERVGYPTQKPRRLLDRIIKASSVPGSVVLDFFAGSGTTGESCLELGRTFILIDNNPSALEVMARRFGNEEQIEWTNFDPSPYRATKASSHSDHLDKTLSLDEDLVVLAAAAGARQSEFDEDATAWENSPFEWLPRLPAGQKNKLGRQLFIEWSASRNLVLEADPDTDARVMLGGKTAEVRLSTISKAGIYKFGRLAGAGCDYAVCLGVSPFAVHCWVPGRKQIEKMVRRSSTKNVVSFSVDPHSPPAWLTACGGTLEQAQKVVETLLRKK